MNLIDFKDVCKAVRKENNLTQEMLGKKLGLCRTTIYNYEHGISLPSAEILLLFSKKFDIDLSLVSDEEFNLIIALRENKKVYNSLISNPLKMINKIKDYML